MNVVEREKKSGRGVWHLSTRLGGVSKLRVCVFVCVGGEEGRTELSVCVCVCRRGRRRKGGLS